MEETDQVSSLKEQCNLWSEYVGDPRMAEMEEWGTKKRVILLAVWGEGFYLCVTPRHKGIMERRREGL